MSSSTKRPIYDLGVYTSRVALSRFASRSVLHAGKYRKRRVAARLSLMGLLMFDFMVI
jgi:hypothetical protein